MITQFLCKSCDFTLQHGTELFSSLQPWDKVDLNTNDDVEKYSVTEWCKEKAGACCIAWDYSLVLMLLKNNEQQTRCIIYSVVRAWKKYVSGRIILFRVNSCWKTVEQGIEWQKGDVDHEASSWEFKDLLKQNHGWHCLIWEWLTSAEQSGRYHLSQPPNVGVDGRRSQPVVQDEGETRSRPIWLPVGSAQST